jgi:hypothetical protein
MLKPLIQRTPIQEWDRECLNWSTLFNDLRNPESLRGARLRTFKRDLKKQAFFYKSFVVRDADVVNCPELLRLVNEDPDMEILIKEGILVFALRESADSFTEVNEAAKERRAFPRQYLNNKDSILKFDSKLREIRIATIEEKSDHDFFRKHLQKLIAGRLGDLQTERLTEAIAYAENLSSGKYLRFGDIYKSKDRIDMQSWSDNDADSWTLKCAPYTFTRPQLAIHYMVP